MDWTFWLGIAAIVALWLLIRWANGAWRQHAERAHSQRVDEVDATEASEARDETDATHSIDGAGTGTGTGATQPEQGGPRRGSDPPNR